MFNFKSNFALNFEQNGINYTGNSIYSAKVSILLINLLK